MLQKHELSLEQLGSLAQVIPGCEPQLRLSIPRIPVTEPGLGGKIIPVCDPTLAGNEMKYVTDCIESNWISSAGKYITRFEDMFAQKSGARYGIACMNGTVALHLALASLDIGPGDEVILPTFTMIATVNAVTYTGATPVLVDSELNTWNMDVTQVEAKITPRTKAIMPVHTYGHPVDMDPLLDIAHRHDLYIIQDAAEAHGAEYKGRKIGEIGDVACFSFYANKILTTGEGGMVLTDDEQIAKIARNLRDHAFSEERHFWHQYLGYNYRMTNLQAAVGLAQTERFEQLVECRRRNAHLYSSMLDVEGLTLPPEASFAKSVFWMYGVLVQPEFGMSRDQLREQLAKRGIETRAFFVPVHLQPIYHEQYGDERYPRAEELCAKGFYFPSSSSLSEKEIEYIATAVRQAQRDARRGS